MPRKNLSKDDIMSYVHPELKTLKALFSSLNLKASVKAVDFMQTVLEFELNRTFKTKTFIVPSCKTTRLQKIP